MGGGGVRLCVDGGGGKETWDQIIQIPNSIKLKIRRGIKICGMHKSRSMPYRRVGGGSCVAHPHKSTQIHSISNQGSRSSTKNSVTGIDCRSRSQCYAQVSRDGKHIQLLHLTQSDDRYPTQNTPVHSPPFSIPSVSNDTNIPQAP